MQTGVKVLRTIVVGSCVSVQGLFVKALENGRIVVEVNGRQFAGTPIARN